MDLASKSGNVQTLRDHHRSHHLEATPLTLLTPAPFREVDLRRRATKYEERNDYGDYRIIELEEGGRMLDGPA